MGGEGRKVRKIINNLKKKINLNLSCVVLRDDNISIHRYNHYRDRGTEYCY